MNHRVHLQDILRQQQMPAEVVSGRTWEERVATLERMGAAMKKSGWTSLVKQHKILPPTSATASNRKI